MDVEKSASAATPDPWRRPPPADPNITWAPTIYADDPPGVVAFLTHPDRPYHLATDAGAYVDDDDIPVVKPCRWCNGSGVYSDEDQSRACPWCFATGEADADE